MLTKVAAEFTNYNRSAAIAYARAYWTAVCTDEYVAIEQSPFFDRVDNGSVFVCKTASVPSREVARRSNGPDKPLDNPENCTHFISYRLGCPNQARPSEPPTRRRSRGQATPFAQPETARIPGLVSFSTYQIYRGTTSFVRRRARQNELRKILSLFSRVLFHFDCRLGDILELSHHPLTLRRIDFDGTNCN